MTKKNKVTGQQLYTLDSLGAVIVRNVIAKKDITKINILIDQHLEKGSPGKFSIMNMGEIFFSLMEIPWVINFCQEILGPNFRFDHSFGLQQPGEGVVANLHGGPLTCQGCNYYITNAGTIRCGRVSVGISLTHQDAQTGGFAFIPGSHKSAFNNSGGEIFHGLLNSAFDHDCVTIPTLNPGDICLFVDGLVHGTTNWTSTTYRRSLYYMYSPGFVAWRAYDQTEKYLGMATTETQRSLLAAPYVAEFEDDNLKLGANKWRKGFYE